MSSISQANFRIFVGSVAVIVAPFFIFLACSTAGTANSGNSFQLRPYQELTTPNGLKVLLIPDHTLPRVSISLSVKTGALYEPADKAGLSHMTAVLLEDGTTHRSEAQIAEQLGMIASEFAVAPGADMTSFASSTLSTQKDRMLDLFSDLILNPAFSDKELAREKSQALAALAHAADNPSRYADELLAKELFGQHPYSRPVLGTEKSVKQLSRTDLVKFYFRYYRPNNAWLTVTGDFDDAFVESVKKAFGSWQKKDIDFPVDIPAAPQTTPKLKLYTKPGLQQSQVRFATLGIRRDDPDFLKLRVANVILGGDFVSRLNMRVRNDLGLTYSIHSYYDAKAEPGEFGISTFTRNDKIVETIRESQAVLQKFVKDGATAEELEAAKALLIGQFPAAIETTDKLAGNLIFLRRYGVGDDYLAHFIRNVNSMSLKDLNDVIHRRFKPDAMEVVVYADQAAVLSQMKTLGAVEVEEVISSSTSGKHTHQDPATRSLNPEPNF